MYKICAVKCFYMLADVAQRTNSKLSRSPYTKGNSNKSKSSSFKTFSVDYGDLPVSRLKSFNALVLGFHVFSLYIHLGVAKSSVVELEDMRLYRAHTLSSGVSDAFSYCNSVGSAEIFSLPSPLMN